MSKSTRKRKQPAVIDRFRELDQQEQKALDEEIAEFSGKRKKKKNFERARDTFQRIQEEKQAEREQKIEDRQRRKAALDQYISTKKKMNQALKKTNRKGQPNLNAQVSVLLEKIQKQCS